MTHGVEFGEIDLVSMVPADEGYTLAVLADGTEFGTPEARTSVVLSQILDGDMVVDDGAGNRVVSLTIGIEAPDGLALSAGEAALRRESYRPNLLVWTPPAVASPSSAFEVVWSKFDRVFDAGWDLDEERRRKYRLELTCAPFPRSVNLTTIAALEAPGATSTVVIDTCDSATSWTGTRGTRGTVPTEGPTTVWQAGSVGVAELDSDVTSPETWTLTRAGAVDFTSTPYLVAEVRTLAAVVGGPMDVTAAARVASGAVVPLPVIAVSKVVNDADDYFKVTYDATGLGAVTALTFAHRSTEGHVWQGLYIRHLSRTNVPPNLTARQTSRVIDIGGTERTPASIHIQSANGADPLGLVIAHSCPEDGSGYSPPLRRWRNPTSGGPETWTGAIFSDYEEPISSNPGFVADVPTSALPEGGYVLMARLRRSTNAATTAAIYWATSTIFPDGVTIEGHVASSTVVDFRDGNWHMVPIAALTLPSVRTKAGKVRIVIQGHVSDDPVIYLDEAWLFRADDGCALTIVETGRPHLWLDSPDVASSVPRVWVGDGRETKVHPGDGLHAMGAHVLSPEGTAVFTASTAASPTTDASAYRRWLHNAAD